MGIYKIAYSISIIAILVFLFSKHEFYFRGSTIRVLGDIDKVWEVVSNLSEYHLWCSLYSKIEIEEDYKEGTQFTVQVNMIGRKLEFENFFIQDIIPKEKICWGLVPIPSVKLTDKPISLRKIIDFFLTSHRCIELSPVDNLGVEVRNYERMTGPIARIIDSFLYQPIVSGFDDYQRDLYKYVMFQK